MKLMLSSCDILLSVKCLKHYLFKIFIELEILESHLYIWRSVLVVKITGTKISFVRE